jgi:ABC-type dipeptide/oligopeptide/nickel transport system ATPase subunit
MRRGFAEFSAGGTFFRRKATAVHVFSELSFVVRRGECIGLVGESGCGKTTCLRCLCGLQKLSAGEILLDGQPLCRISRRQFCRRVQIIFQCPYDALNPLQTVESILTEPLQLHFPKMKRTQRQDRMVELLSAVQLNENLLQRKPGALSGGQRQRLAIARSLAVKPDFLLCDEVVSALDAAIQGEILELIGTLRRKTGLGVLFVSHNRAAAAILCDKIYNFSNGRMSLLSAKDATY